MDKHTLCLINLVGSSVNNDNYHITAYYYAEYLSYKDEDVIRAEQYKIKAIDAAEKAQTRLYFGK